MRAASDIILINQSNGWKQGICVKCAIFLKYALKPPLFKFNNLFNPLSGEFFFTENNFLQPIFKQFCKLNFLFYTQTMYITFVAHK